VKYLPAVFDVAGFVALTAGTYLLAGPGVALVVAGVLLVVAGYTAGS
jgi:hypothetical protein